MTINNTEENSGGAKTETVKVEAKVAPGDETEQKVGDVLKQMDPSKVVGLDKFLELKKQNKEMRKDLTSLMDSIKSGATERETRDEIAELAKNHDVNPEFLKTLVATIEKNVSKKFETAGKGKKEAKADDGDDDDSDDQDEGEKVSPEKVNTIFNTHYDKIIDRMPEFAEVVNKEVIRELSKLPSNSNKTLTQIIEDTYGKTLTGKRTIDSGKPGAGKEAKPIDYARAKKDTDYFLEIMKDPDLKREYNANLISKGL